jgi:hypothetical protein
VRSEKFEKEFGEFKSPLYFHFGDILICVQENDCERNIRCLDTLFCVSLIYGIRYVACCITIIKSFLLEV